MTPTLSGHNSMFGLVSFVLKSLLGIARQWSRRKFAILSVKPLFAAQTTPLIFRFCFATSSPITSFTCIQSTVELSSLGNQVC